MGLLLERERGVRIGDGLGAGVWGRWERGRACRAAAGVVTEADDEISEDDEDEICGSAAEVGSSEATEKSLCLATTDGARNLNLNLGVEDTFRREVIEWMLDVRILV
jgi:hypothetical protein